MNRSEKRERFQHAGPREKGKSRSDIARIESQLVVIEDELDGVGGSRNLSKRQLEAMAERAFAARTLAQCLRWQLEQEIDLEKVRRKHRQVMGNGRES